MGQKILAYFFYGFLVLMVIIAVILLKYQLDQKALKQQQIQSRANVVTYTETADDDQPAASSDKGSPKKDLSAANNRPPSDPDWSQQNPDTLSYSDIYQQLNLAKNCQPIFRTWQSDGSEADLTQLIGKPYVYYGDVIYETGQKPPPTPAQTQLLQQWQGQCLNLWRIYGDYDPSLNENQRLVTAIVETIEQRLNKTAAKTQREKQIKQVLNLSKQWQLRFNALEQALAGENSLTEAELADIQNQIQQLSGEQFRIITESQNNSDLSEQISDINQEISQLNEVIANQKVKNPNTIEQAKVAFEAIDQQLFKQFYTTYGAVFYEALSTVVGHDNLRYLGSGFSLSGQASHQRITPVDMVLEANNIRNNLWHKESISSATLLYLCDLGIDCSATSGLMINFCLTGYPNYPDACGLTVQDFLRHHFISPNQWSDVNRLKGSYQEIFNG